ncbi:hypothetical protein L930_03285 [Helicobacter pylori PZ5004]|nr:hypothetical protein L930_03285 [Helicobacter pylori PZ5004]
MSGFALNFWGVLFFYLFIQFFNLVLAFVK